MEENETLDRDDLEHNEDVSVRVMVGPPGARGPGVAGRLRASIIIRRFRVTVRI
jgi:hypothetical protein